MSRLHKEHINKHKTIILRRMAQYAKDNGKNEVPLRILRDDINDYNNAQKLRYHALIFKVKRGTWGITSYGLEFLKGERELPRYVYISDNKIVERSREMVNIRDLVYESGAPAETFEYLENGKTVVRPHAYQQQALSWL